MSARIEIPMEQFKALNSELEALKKTNCSLIDKTMQLNREKEDLQHKLDEIKSLQFFERVFHWKKSINI